MQPAEDQPVACTLDGGMMPVRLSRIKALTDTSLLSYQVQGRRLHLEYRPEAIDEVRAIAELERTCCDFLAQIFPDGSQQVSKHGCGCTSEKVCG
jgi:hypothetical protein